MEKNETTDTPLVLIVDDNPKNLQILGNYLLKEGFNVEFALDGNSALDWIERTEFDIILLDIVMPGMNGLEVCRIIKNDPVKHKIPVIFLSAAVDTESILDGFDIGAVDYIIKPFNQKELIARVRTQIEIKRSRDKISKNLKEIEYKNKLITYSIKYAQKIQTSLMKKSQNGSDFFTDFFCLILPKDIVSGDFYWLHKTDNKFLVGVFDCSGHGIPGAFMSILGVTLLNETVIREKITDPNLILNRLREKVIEALGQKGTFSEVRDGMDGSVISYDLLSRNLVYSGSYNPMYLIRDNKIIEFKGDKMPLSYHLKMDDFSTQEMVTKPDDLIYLFTDGYKDQFGGPYLKKFRSAQFKEALLKNHKEPLNVQKHILHETYIKWRGQEEQVDDITVLGLKL